VRLGWVYFPMTVARARCHQPLRRGRGGSAAAAADAAASAAADAAASAAASAPPVAEDATVGSELTALAARALGSCSSALAVGSASAAVSP
jgi:hypothetical protein